ncbi:heterokaryon incompatibility, partial [Mytilinidion resinicola]
IAYITLSHRWGNSKFLNLTMSNMAQLKGEINFDDLPQTFQDSVTASRVLGYEYVWIDSLCII